MKANRKTIRCQQCGREMVVGAEAETARCWSCTGFVGDPPGGGSMLEVPGPGDVKDCANLVGGKCIVREHKKCIVLNQERCGWFEKAVRPAGKLSGRACSGCGGAVSKGHRYCDDCQSSRRRAASRKAQAKKRAACQHSVAPAPQ